MEEKKLTDEEIVNDIERSTGMPSYWKKIVLDLIYRLQDEKQKVVQDYYCEAQHCDVQKDIIEKQKAEIERLTEENWQLKGYNNGLEYENHELQKQVDELTAFKNEAISMSLYGKGRKDGEEVAVKDTAKEICDLILEHWEKGELIECDWLRVAISERYGVEVE